MYFVRTTLAFAIDDIDDVHKLNDKLHRMIQGIDPIGRLWSSDIEKAHHRAVRAYKVARQECGEAKWLRRFILFGSNRFAASGGWSDFIGSFNYIDQAKEAAEKTSGLVWAQIVDGATGKELFKELFIGDFIPTHNRIAAWREVCDERESEV